MDPKSPPGAELAAKIARLVEERGWNQEDFARIAQLNRQTVRQILQAAPTRKLRNATISACARALGLTVSELRDLPLVRLLPRMHGHPPGPDDDLLKHLHERAAQPELVAWLERNPDRVRRFSAADVADLLEHQGPDGALAKLGVERYVEILERRRDLLRKVEAIAGSEYLGFLEQFVDLLYEKVRPADGRG
jgi:transcriptional regulator with XRE-family HTH domain